MRARELGIKLLGTPGPLNAITDVPGLTVGMVTLNHNDCGANEAVRTGVTAILPLGRDGITRSVAAGIYSLNGNGEMTGSHWINETGALSGPVMITNTHAVGTVHRGVVDWMAANEPMKASEWLLPVVAETWDGYLNSINLPSVVTADAGRAIDAATSGPVPEGSVGGGTGMNCYGFKGGSGTSSRQVSLGGQTYTVAAFLQCNFGDRHELTITGVPMNDLDVPYPMGEQDWILRDRSTPVPPIPGGAGSVIAVVATDAPMTPHQTSALARRVPLGLARTGTTGGHFSGDIFLGFSTANPGELDSGFSLIDKEQVTLRSLEFVPWNWMDEFYAAVVQCVEESVLNALVNNETMYGRAGSMSPALPLELVMARLNRP